MPPRADMSALPGALQFGGAIYLQTLTTVSITTSRFERNEATTFSLRAAVQSGLFDSATDFVDVSRAATCTETAGISVPEDKAACEAVAELADGAACHAILTNDAADAADAKACAYAEAASLNNQGGAMYLRDKSAASIRATAFVDNRGSPSGDHVYPRAHSLGTVARTNTLGTVARTS